MSKRVYNFKLVMANDSADQEKIIEALSILQSLYCANEHSRVIIKKDGVNQHFTLRKIDELYVLTEFVTIA